MGARRTTAVLGAGLAVMGLGGGCGSPEKSSETYPLTSRAVAADRALLERTQLVTGVGCAVSNAVDRGLLSPGRRLVELTVTEQFNDAATRLLVSHGHDSTLVGMFVLVPQILGNGVNVNGKGPVANGGKLATDMGDRTFELFPPMGAPDGTQISIDETVIATSTDPNTGAKADTRSKVHCSTLVFADNTWRIDLNAVVPQ